MRLYRVCRYRLPEQQKQTGRSRAMTTMQPCTYRAKRELILDAIGVRDGAAIV